MKEITKRRKDYFNKINSIDFIKEYSPKPKINRGADIHKQFKWLEDMPKEFFVVAHMNTKNDIISHEITSVGILDASIIHPREVFKTAILQNSSRIILIHNHPSGDPAPSDEDLRITTKFKEAGELLGIEVLDHIIIGKNKFWSYIEN
jgi:DNA repair protein RadC